MLERFKVKYGFFLKIGKNIFFFQDIRKIFLTSKMEQNPSSCSIGIWNYPLPPSKLKSRIFPGPYPSPLCPYRVFTCSKILFCIFLNIKVCLISSHNLLYIWICQEKQKNKFFKNCILQRPWEKVLLQTYCQKIYLNGFKIQLKSMWGSFWVSIHYSRIIFWCFYFIYWKNVLDIILFFDD